MRVLKCQNDRMIMKKLVNKLQESSFTQVIQELCEGLACTRIHVSGACTQAIRGCYLLLHV